MELNIIYDLTAQMAKSIKDRIRFFVKKGLVDSSAAPVISFRQGRYPRFFFLEIALMHKKTETLYQQKFQLLFRHPLTLIPIKLGFTIQRQFKAIVIL